MSTRLLLTVTVVAFLVTGSGGSRCHSGEVTVYLKNGRNVSGEVDSRTSDKLLWLRTSSPGIVLRSAFEWNQIAHARHNNQALSSETLHKLSSKLKSEIPEDVFLRRQKEQPKAVPPNDAHARADSWRAFHSRRVRSLQIESSVANWDDDVEPDGLRVFVYPLDAEGRIIPVDGSLEFTLIGQTQRASTTDRFRRRSLFPELHRWSHRVHKTDFEPWGAVYEIPFTRFHPEFDLDIAVDALLNARLGIAGQGVFDASDAHINLRPHSRIRDELQQLTGRRFSPSERASRFGH